MRRRGLLLSLVLIAGGCARGSVGSPAPSEAAQPLAPSGRPREAERADANLVPTPPVGEWASAVRERRWHDAARLIDALSSTERERPEVKYARAVVAIEVADPARAVKLFAGLDEKLPVLKDEIAAHRADAQAEAGPFADAAKYFEAQKTSASLVKAAAAWERAGDLKKARKAADRSLVLATPSGKRDTPSREEVAARAARARIAEKQKDAAVATMDLRWLATYAPTADQAADVDQRLEKLAPKRALSARERYDRAVAMAREGQIDRVERELALVPKASGATPSEAELLHAKGLAHYSARSYPKAAELLERAATLGGPTAPGDLFHAARARSRAHQDDRAIAMYREVAKRYPKSGFAEQAHFLVARLLYIMGRWDKAADAYAAYLRSGKDGRYVESAQYEQAVSWLAAKQHKKAAKALGRLADHEDNDIDRAGLRELEGVALAGAGKKPDAIKSLTSVIEDKPLSFAALSAATRLGQLGAKAPAPIDPPKNTPVRPSLSVELPPKAKLLQALGLDIEAEAVLRSEEDKLRRHYAPRGDEALCTLYGKLSEAARRYRVGQQAAAPDDLNRAPGADTRWLWDCVYPRPYPDVVHAAEVEWKLPDGLVYAVMRQESGFQPRVVSPANAVGLMQLIPPTAESAARELKLDFEPSGLASPAMNIRLGSFYLSKVLGTFGGNVVLAAAAYNAGPNAVSRWLESGEGLPLDVFVARIPYRETRGYVSRVVGNLARYAYLDGGDAAVPKLALEIEKGLRAPPEAY
jgi:peptidoglycan lytic transglycosylase